MENVKSLTLALPSSLLLNHGRYQQIPFNLFYYASVHLFYAKVKVMKWQDKSKTNLRNNMIATTGFQQQTQFLIFFSLYIAQRAMLVHTSEPVVAKKPASHEILAYFMEPSLLSL